MNHEIRVLGELGSEFERVALRSQPRPQRLTRRWRPLALLAVLVLGGTTGALAAVGVIPIGGSVSGANGFRSATTGPGRLQHGSVRLLGVRTADPGGGLRWGMRFFTTTRGLGCLTVGRAEDGRLGVLGIDDVFGNDGAFHPIPAGSEATSPACGPLDRGGRLILSAVAGSVPASGLNANGLRAGGCLPPSVHEPGGTFCPARDERILYYGLLGPAARSLTYTTPDGAQHTLATKGPAGAYLIVQRWANSPGAINDGMSVSIQPGPPIIAVTYRNGLRCSFADAATLPRACAVPPGYLPPRTPVYTAAQLASPVTATIRPARAGAWKLTVTFVARVAVTNALSRYYVTLQTPHGGYGFSRNVNIRVGTRITYQPLVALRLPPGVYHGSVRFTTSTTPGAPPGPGIGGPGGGNSILVGGFTIRIPPHPA